MLTFAKWQFWASGYDKGSKISRKDSLKQVAKTIGKNPKQLDEEPKLRDELLYIWSLFVSLKNVSSDRISYSEIKAYMSIYGELSIFEVDAICHLDMLHFKETNKNG